MKKSERRSERLTVLLTALERRFLEREAEKRKMHISELARERLFQEVKR